MTAATCTCCNGHSKHHGRHRSGGEGSGGEDAPAANSRPQLLVEQRGVANTHEQPPRTHADGDFTRAGPAAERKPNRCVHGAGRSTATDSCKRTADAAGAQVRGCWAGRRRVLLLDRAWRLVPAVHPHVLPTASSRHLQRYSPLRFPPQAVGICSVVVCSSSDHSETPLEF
jgi:hypothetical protein